MPNMSKQQHPVPAQDPKTRVTNFDEVTLGYTLNDAVSEACRCIQCKDRPCVGGCPVMVNIPDFLSELAAGNVAAAYDIITGTNNLPAICGRVCPQEQQCEAVCTRGRNGEPVAIGRLERFVADYIMGNEPKECAGGLCPVTHLEKVAVCGAGPAGLACAADLKKLGYDVTVFEAFHIAGGVLMYGIPEFRLPKSIVQAEIKKLLQMGVVIKYDTVIGKTLSINDIFEMGYASVFIGTGAGLPNFMGIPGEQLPQVYSANEFLTRINLMRAASEDSDTPIKKSRRTAVIGGGNVAMDAARAAVRTGSEVTILYRRGENEMPARHEEVVNAREEGVDIRCFTAVSEINGDENGNVVSVTTEQMALGEPDESGRHRPVPVPKSEKTLYFDSVIMAIGNSPGKLLAMSGEDIEFDRRGRIVVGKSLMTSRRGVFAGGDTVTGAATVIEAMGAGKKAAAAMHEYMRRT